MTTGLLPLVPTWLCELAAAVALVRAAMVDARERRLPNALTLAVAVLGFGQMALVAALRLPEPAGFSPVPVRILSASATLVVLFVFEQAWRRVRGSSGLGYGDVKLLGALALWVGPSVSLVLAVSALLAACVGIARGARSFAFGPYLVACGIVVMAVQSLP